MTIFIELDILNPRSFPQTFRLYLFMLNGILTIILLFCLKKLELNMKHCWNNTISLHLDIILSLIGELFGWEDFVPYILLHRFFKQCNTNILKFLCQLNTKSRFWRLHSDEWISCMWVTSSWKYKVLLNWISVDC